MRFTKYSAFNLQDTKSYILKDNFLGYESYRPTHSFHISSNTVV
jgi:hypothetical protein